MAMFATILKRDQICKIERRRYSALVSACHASVATAQNSTTRARY